MERNSSLNGGLAASDQARRKDRAFNARSKV